MLALNIRDVNLGHELHYTKLQSYMHASMAKTVSLRSSALQCCMGIALAWARPVLENCSQSAVNACIPQNCRQLQLSSAGRPL